VRIGTRIPFALVASFGLWSPKGPGWGGSAEAEMLVVYALRNSRTDTATAREEYKGSQGLATGVKNSFGASVPDPYAHCRAYCPIGNGQLAQRNEPNRKGEPIKLKEP